MADANSDTCPRCGAPRSAAAPAGLCPRCLLGQALGTDGGPSESLAPEELARVLETLTATSGPMPRVLLPDTGGGDDDAPLVRPASEEMPPPADRPARVQLLGEIARGGMGAVLKGRDPDLGRDLAVKVLLEAHRDTPELVRRFVEEAQIGGQLQHPGVVPVYELGTFGESRPYFTMKLVKGRTLAESLGDRAAPGDDLPRFLGIFEQIAQTVAYAHARGVIHRDLKPSNVMVGGFGEVQVMDWGLAKVLPRGGVVEDREAGKTPAHETVIATARSGDDDPDLSRAGSVLGTPAYMAPEQARGETDRLDERCDVFALGSILCEILTGLPAFTGRNSGEMLRKASRADLADAFGRLESCGADAELVDLARHCLAPEPEDRPAGAQEVADRLLAYTGSVHRRMREAEIARAAEAARAEEAERTAEAAEARARAERAARRLQVGGVALALALSLVGGLSFLFWYRQRQAGAVRNSEAIVESWTLLNQARAAPGDVSRWEAAQRSLKEAARAKRPHAPPRSRTSGTEPRGSSPPSAGRWRPAWPPRNAIVGCSIASGRSDSPATRPTPPGPPPTPPTPRPSANTATPPNTAPTSTGPGSTASPATSPNTASTSTGPTSTASPPTSAPVLRALPPSWPRPSTTGTPSGPGRAPHSPAGDAPSSWPGTSTPTRTATASARSSSATTREPDASD